jgi:C4-dicarboxylate-specific signal transduction histidine kinase
VNNALQVISGTVELLDARKDLPAAVTQMLERLGTQSRRAAAAMAEVHVFAKATRGQSAPTNMKDVVTHCLALRQFAMRRAEVTSRLETDGSSFLIIGNSSDLQQALLNVLINAEQAVPSRAGTIVVKLASEPGFVTVTVTDNGPGFTVEPVNQGLAPFVTNRDPLDSAGLGLWAARVIVIEHGGTITVESSPHGAAVVMRLPASATRPAVTPPVRD